MKSCDLDARQSKKVLLPSLSLNNINLLFLTPWGWGGGGGGLTPHYGVVFGLIKDLVIYTATLKPNPYFQMCAAAPVKVLGGFVGADYISRCLTIDDKTSTPISTILYIKSFLALAPVYLTSIFFPPDVQNWNTGLHVSSCENEVFDLWLGQSHLKHGP